MNVNAVLVIHGLETEFTYVAKTIEIYSLEFVLENPHNFFIREACKLEKNV